MRFNCHLARAVSKTTCVAGLALALLASACNPPVPTVVVSPTPLATLTATVPPTITLTPTSTPTPIPTATPTPTPLPTPMALVVSVLAENKVKLHREPDAQSEVVGELGPGMFVPLVDLSEDGLWLKVGADPEGWASGIEVSLSGDVLAGDATAPKRQALLQADTPVNVRNGPGTRFKVLGQLKSGQVVPVLDQNEDGSWLQIPFGRAEGWVNASTVIVAGGEPTPTPTPTAEVTREP
jgi:uncharacterized protein YgiM (DUF1202 family)